MSWPKSGGRQPSKYRPTNYEGADGFRTVINQTVPENRGIVFTILAFDRRLAIANRRSAESVAIKSCRQNDYKTSVSTGSRVDPGRNGVTVFYERTIPRP